MIRRPPRSTLSSSSAASDVYKRQPLVLAAVSPPPASPAAAASPSEAADVVVYVCGAVKSPGVVRVPAGARVADALALAGGPDARAELAAVNLAAKVVDGQQIM